jgi:hypothetical protein
MASRAVAGRTLLNCFMIAAVCECTASRAQPTRTCPFLPRLPRLRRPLRLAQRPRQLLPADRAPAALQRPDLDERAREAGALRRNPDVARATARTRADDVPAGTSLDRSSAAASPHARSAGTTCRTLGTVACGPSLLPPHGSAQRDRSRLATVLLLARHVVSGGSFLASIPGSFLASGEAMPHEAAISRCPRCCSNFKRRTS